MSAKFLLRTCSYTSCRRRLFSSVLPSKNKVLEEKETHFGFTNVKVHEKSQKVYKVFAGVF